MSAPKIQSLVTRKLHVIILKVAIIVHVTQAFPEMELTAKVCNISENKVSCMHQYFSFAFFCPVFLLTSINFNISMLDSVDIGGFILYIDDNHSQASLIGHRDVSLATPRLPLAIMKDTTIGSCTSRFSGNEFFEKEFDISRKSILCMHENFNVPCLYPMFYLISII